MTSTKKRIAYIAGVFIIFCALIFAPLNVAAAFPEDVLEARHGVVRVLAESDDGLMGGTGFIIGTEADWYIVTNVHVVAKNANTWEKFASEIYVSYETDNLIPAEVVAFDGAYDIAVLKVSQDIPNKVILSLAAEELTQGVDVFALGYPVFMDMMSDEIITNLESMTITSGNINSIRDNVYFGNETLSLRTINSDVIISGGNSGGPLVTTNGNVCGINTMGATQTTVAMSLHVDEIMAMLDANNITYTTSDQSLIARQAADESGGRGDRDRDRDKETGLAALLKNPAIIIAIIAAVLLIVVVIIVAVTSGKNKKKNLHPQGNAHPIQPPYGTPQMPQAPQHGASPYGVNHQQQPYAARPAQSPQAQQYGQAQQQVPVQRPAAPMQPQAQQYGQAQQQVPVQRPAAPMQPQAQQYGQAQAQQQVPVQRPAASMQPQAQQYGQAQAQPQAPVQHPVALAPATPQHTSQTFGQQGAPGYSSAPKFTASAAAPTQFQPSAPQQPAQQQPYVQPQVQVPQALVQPILTPATAASETAAKELDVVTILTADRLDNLAHPDENKTNT